MSILRTLSSSTLLIFPSSPPDTLDEPMKKAAVESVRVALLEITTLQSVAVKSETEGDKQIDMRDRQGREEVRGWLTL